MEKITFVTRISKSGGRIYLNIPLNNRVSEECVVGKQVKVTVEDI